MKSRIVFRIVVALIALLMLLPAFWVRPLDHFEPLDTDDMRPGCVADWVSGSLTCFYRTTEGTIWKRSY